MMMLMAMWRMSCCAFYFRSSEPNTQKEDPHSNSLLVWVLSTDLHRRVASGQRSREVEGKCMEGLYNKFKRLAPDNFGRGSLKLVVAHKFHPKTLTLPHTETRGPSTTPPPIWQTAPEEINRIVLRHNHNRIHNRKQMTQLCKSCFGQSSYPHTIMSGGKGTQHTEAHKY